MTSRERIVSAWRRARRMADPPYPLHSYLENDAPLSFVDAEVDLSEMGITSDLVKFTFEHCWYVNEGDVYEWWNVVCDDVIVDYLPYQRRTQENSFRGPK